MASLKEQRLLLVKIAAIGDVVLACRALLPFLDVSQEVEVHWIIDEKLQPLAESLLRLRDEGLLRRFHFHAFDSKKLFAGSVAEKIKATLGFLMTAQRVSPTHVALLHRDKRYVLPFRANPATKLFQVKRASGVKSEFELYSEVFETIFEKKSSHPSSAPVWKRHGKNGALGILVGGGKNAKTVFLEKRWPHLADFIDLVLKKTDYEIALYGGPEDTALAADLKRRFGSPRLRDQTSKLSLAELPAEFSSLAAFVGIDSGLTHIAATVMNDPGQKVVALYGPTNPVTWAPPRLHDGQPSVLFKKLECSPCYDDSGDFRPCKFSGPDFQKCMKEITPEEVLQLLPR